MQSFNRPWAARTAAVAVCAALAVTLAGCGDTGVTDIRISRAWTNATPPAAPSALGYMTIVNAGSASDRLLSATSSVAGTAMLHQMQITNGVASMRMVDGVTIPPGQTVVLDPPGMHLMFEPLKQQLKEGEKLPVTLTFEKAGKVDVVLQIYPVGSRGPGAETGGR